MMISDVLDTVSYHASCCSIVLLLAALLFLPRTKFCRSLRRQLSSPPSSTVSPQNNNNNKKIEDVYDLAADIEKAISPPIEADSALSDDIVMTTTLTTTTTASTVSDPVGNSAAKDPAALSGGERNRDELEAAKTQKKLLKVLLKEFDNAFAKKHRRSPTKAEKEPVRYLYEMYNDVKSRIILLESNFATVRPTLTMEERSALEVEKVQLYTVLQDYETEFCRKHNRPVSCFADIKPMKYMYRRYKKIKKEIKQQKQQQQEENSVITA